MRLVCAPESVEALPSTDCDLRVNLYGQGSGAGVASAGAAACERVIRSRMNAAPQAWDFTSIALSVLTADFAVLRNTSPDGWTRELTLDIAVTDPDFWAGQADALTNILGFLTTDIWQLNFFDGGTIHRLRGKASYPREDCVTLLSGGLDSLIGAIDVAASGMKPFAVSQTVRGDGGKQRLFAQTIGNGLNHLQVSPAVHTSGTEEHSQRARSLMFFAFGLLVATSLRKYHLGDTIPLYVPENGFIAHNPSLTGTRLGSLSTRTAHPFILSSLQELLNAAELHVEIVNPYHLKTKGEMLIDCADQLLISTLATQSTSCGRFQRYNYQHCGRCVPCQVRRASMIKWGVEDLTPYVFCDLGKNDADHSGFDDVRAVSMASQQVRKYGVDDWLGTTLCRIAPTERAATKNVIVRGLAELHILHKEFGVK